MIVPGILVCSRFLISVFIVSKTLLISSATVIVRAGGGVCAPYVVSLCDFAYYVVW